MVNLEEGKGFLVVLGAGVTGLTAADALARRFGPRIVVLERELAPGGLAQSFSRGPWTFDLGSHRIHEGYDPEALRLVRELCGADLLQRQRRGRIHLAGRFLPYPPSPLDIVCSYGPRQGYRFLHDLLAGRFRHFVNGADLQTFESYCIARVGQSLYHHFYRPYAEKLWGLPASEVSFEPAASRVKRFEIRSLWKAVERLFGGDPTPSYYYPARGIGQITESLRRRVLASGGQLLLGCDLERLTLRDDRHIESLTFRQGDGTRVELPVAALIATIPLDQLHGLVRLESEGGVPPPFDLRWRGLRILYLLTARRRPSATETYYFPESRLLIGRVSELHLYSPALNQGDLAALTIEIPCSVSDRVWSLDEARLAEHCLGELEALEILAPAPREQDEFFSRRLPQVYPVYERGWRRRYDRIQARLGSIDNLFPIGRPALFLHCNIDHGIAMALRLSRFLLDGPADKSEWQALQEQFYQYRVRD